MGTLEIRLFGTLTLRRDERNLTKSPSKRVRELLSYLVLNWETVHSREYLAGLIWAELDDRRARRCLNTALWRLHRILAPDGLRHAPCLRVDSRFIGFDPESDVRIDVAEFERHCQWAEQLGDATPDQRAQLYRRAVELYRGQLLSECYEDWCILERERLQNMYLRALTHLFDYYAERGEYAAAASHARRILVLDALREEVHRDLIDLYLAAGHPAQALRQYRECEQVLARELGIEPMEETKARLHQLLEETQLSNQTPRTTFQSQAGPSATSDSDSDLSTSLARLHDSLAHFDDALVDLQEAITEVTSAARRLEYTVPEVDSGIPLKRMSAVEQVRTAARVVEMASKSVSGWESRH